MDDVASVIFSYLNIQNAIVLRSVSKSWLELVRDYRWDDSTIIYNVNLWRKCFPYAISANLKRTNANDIDLALFSGIQDLDLSYSCKYK
jgi:hypothetical protein